MKHGISGRALVALLAVVLVIGCAAGGTVAYLATKTETVTNTFTVGNINVELSETNRDYKIVPGVDIEKTLKVTVKKDSEACWLFVEVKEEGTFVADKVTYSIADGWTNSDSTNIPANVYYRSVDAVTTDTDFYVLAGNKAYPNGVVTVSSLLTKEDIKDITTEPTLTFTAYAVQKDGIGTAADAWTKVAATTAKP